MDINVGVVGATGLVGYEMIKCIEQLNDSRINIFCYATCKSEGTIIETKNGKYTVMELKEDSFKGLHYVLLALNAETSAKYAPIANKDGCIVIDNSSYFRLEENVPLVCVGCNDEEIFKHNGIVANPNCSTIQLMRSLKIIRELYGINKVIVSTYQSVSGIGKKALEEYYTSQCGKLAVKENFPYPSSNIHYSINDNAIPQIDAFDIDSCYSKEELKMCRETDKILNGKLNLIATCVRIPTYRGHGESVYVETEKDVDIEKIREIFCNDPYLLVKDDLEKQEYPLINECYYEKCAIIGRIRKDLFKENAVVYYCVGDNLYLGAAYNAVEILRLFIERM